MKHLYPISVLLCGLLAGCSAPRSVINSGKVTAKGTVKAGGTMVVNVASETSYRLGLVGRDAIKALGKKDTVLLDKTVENGSAAAISYALDPTGVNYDLYLRYGFAKRFDFGYKFAFGAQAIDAMYQFLGPTGRPDDPEPEGHFYGSIGLQYSWQKADLPNWLDELNPLLRFSARRKDLLVPLIFSVSFGPEEKYGHFGFGLVYQRSFLRYGFNPGQLFNKATGEVLEKVPTLNEKKNYNAWGGFLNAKIGYQHVYVLPALAIYYQRYGRYELPGGREVKLSGITVVPTLGVQFWLWRKQAR